MTEPVKYVTFGGAQVPEGTKRKVIDRNGQKIYCVWTDDKGGKVTYSEQHAYPSNQFVYTEDYFYAPQISHEQKYISKKEFDTMAENVRATATKSWDFHGIKNYEASYYGYEHNMTEDPNNGTCYIKTRNETDKATWYFNKQKRETTPRIEVSTDKGAIFDTQNVTLSNMRGATVIGSTDEDNITLMNSSNCTVDISNANNNIFVSDNVRVVNGQGNKVKAGDHDQVTFGTHNYETNTDTTKANHEGEGTYRQ